MKRKKIIVLLIALFAAVFIGNQLYLYNEHEGNLIVYVSNQSETNNVRINMQLDGKKQIEDVFTNESFHHYKRFPLKVGFGRHDLLFEAKEYALSSEIEINASTVKWVIVEFSEDVNGHYTLFVREQGNSLIIE